MKQGEDRPYDASDFCDTWWRVRFLLARILCSRSARSSFDAAVGSRRNGELPAASFPQGTLASAKRRRTFAPDKYDEVVLARDSTV